MDTSVGAVPALKSPNLRRATVQCKRFNKCEAVWSPETQLETERTPRVDLDQRMSTLSEVLAPRSNLDLLETERFVRFGSQPAIEASLPHVRSIPRSGRRQLRQPSRLRAKSGLMHPRGNAVFVQCPELSARLKDHVERRLGRAAKACESRLGRDLAQSTLAGLGA